MGLGAACGYGFGTLMTWIVNHIHLEVEGLYPVLMLSLVFFTFSFTDLIGGNAFLAVYISAILLGNSNFIHKKSMMKFYDGQAWLMQIVMFVSLGLLVYPSKIIPAISDGVIISLFLIFLARPVAVFISLAFARDYNIRKKLFISWVGLRGAAPIVFATYPLLAGIKYADTIFHLVFFISASSVLLQGTMLSVVAKWLHVAVPESVRRKFPLDIEIKDGLNNELIELDIIPPSPSIGKAVVDLDLPAGALIVLIHRDGQYLSPNGETIIEPNDHLLIMADTQHTVDKIYLSFGMVPNPH
jgi:cell volume regulation protein A